MCSSFSLLWVLFGRAPRAPGPRVDVDHSRCSCFTASWCTLACEEGRYVQGLVHRGGPSPFSRHFCPQWRHCNCDCCWLLVFQNNFVGIFMGDLPSTRQNVLRSQVGSTSHQSIRPPLSTRPPLMSALSQPSREFYSHREECQPAPQ